MGRLNQRLREAIELLRQAGDPAPTTAVIELLTSCRVRADPALSTASIRRLDEGLELRIGEDFAERWLTVPENMGFVLGHETAHYLEGHMDLPGLPGIPRDFVNWALEIPTNARVMKLFFPEGAPLLGGLYPLDRLETCMLRPPTDLIARLVGEGIDPGPFRGLDHRQLCALLDTGPHVQARLAALLQEQLGRLPGAERHAGIAALYVEGWTRPQEPVDWLLHCLDALGREVHSARWRAAPLLGEHQRATGRGSRKWMSRFNIVYQRHRREQELELDLAVDEPPELLRQRFLEAVRPALAPWLPRAPSGEGRNQPTLIPHPGRREMILRAVGARPLTSLARRPEPAPAQTRVHLYPDASMSMMDAHQWYPALASLLGDTLMEPIWAWSRLVRPVNLEQLLRGHLPTDGWTCIEPVVEHAIAREHERVLVITDGEFHVEQGLPARVRDAGLEIVFLLIGEGHFRVEEALRDLATHIVTFSP